MFKKMKWSKDDLEHKHELSNNMYNEIMGVEQKSCLDCGGMLDENSIEWKNWIGKSTGNFICSECFKKGVIE